MFARELGRRRPEEEVDMLLILKGADKIWCWGEKVISAQMLYTARIGEEWQST